MVSILSRTVAARIAAVISITTGGFVIKSAYESSEKAGPYAARLARWLLLFFCWFGAGYFCLIAGFGTGTLTALNIARRHIRVNAGVVTALVSIFA
jgi:hypothetical protein